MSPSSHGSRIPFLPIVLTCMAGYLITIALTLDIAHRDWYVDENIFIPTVKLFFDHPTFSTLATYPEIPGPLSFIMYAAWAGMVGFSTFKLRLFSMVLAAAVFLLVFLIVKKETGKPITGLFAMLLFMINPYMAGLSVFVFTDMAMLFFLLLAWYCYIRKSPILVACALAGALLCRQYAGILAGAITLSVSLQWILTKRADVRMFFAALLSLVPLGLLVMLWGGPSTKAGLAKYVYSYQLHFGNYLVLYVATFWVYLLPVIIWKGRPLLFNRINIITGTLCSAFYPLVPVTISELTREKGGFPANGFVHRAVQAITPGTFAEHALFMLLFLIGSTLLAGIFRDTLRRIINRQFDNKIVIDFVIFLFLVLMPLQYQVWEKYLLIMLPFVIFRFATGKSTAGNDAEPVISPRPSD